MEITRCVLKDRAMASTVRYVPDTDQHICCYVTCFVCGWVSPKDINMLVIAVNDVEKEHWELLFSIKSYLEGRHNKNSTSAVVRIFSKSYLVDTSNTVTRYLLKVRRNFLIMSISLACLLQAFCSVYQAVLTVIVNS